jgi:hypothetical protein
MNQIYEGYFENSSAKDGGVIFQAKVSHDISWTIENGRTVFNQNSIKTKLHEVKVFPDLNYKSGQATSVYYVLSEINILKRKFDLASRFIKRQISPQYSVELDAAPDREDNLNERHFMNTQYQVNLKTNKIILREISTSGIDTGSPSVVLKISTGLADQADGQLLDPWSNFNVKVNGSGINMEISESSNVKISAAKEYDLIENKSDLIFQTIIPSLHLKFAGDRVNVETFSSRSNNLWNSSKNDIETIFSNE